MIEITGYTRDEINRLGWYQSLYPDPQVRARAAERMARMRLGDDLRNEEWTITRKNGERRVARFSTSQIVLQTVGFAVFAMIQDVTEQKQIEWQLRESQERLQLAMDASALGPWVWDIASDQVYFSPAWKAQLGFEPNEMSGTHSQWLERLYPADRAVLHRRLNDYLQGRIPEYSIEYRYLNKAGDYRWISTRGVVHRDPEGQPMRMVGCHIDITDQKRNEEILRHILKTVTAETGQEYFSKLVQYLCTDCGVEIVSVAAFDEQRPGVARTIGFAQAGKVLPNVEYELSGTPCAEVWSSISVCHYAAGVQEMFPDDRLLSDLGIQSYLGIPLISSQNQPIGLLSLMHTERMEDPSRATTMLQVPGARTGVELERLRAEQALRESEQRLSLVSATMPQSLYVDNLSTQETEFVNREVGRDLGYSQEELENFGPNLLHQLIHPEDAERMPDLLRRWETAREGEVFETDYRLRAANGE